MTIHPEIAALLETSARLAGDLAAAEARRAARVAWSRTILADLAAAQSRADAAWAALVEANEHLDDDALEALPPPPEEAEVLALHATVQRVVKHDRWPRALHWGGI